MVADLDFHHYHPRDGHPDWHGCHAEARELADRIAPLIVKDADLTIADRLRDAARKAKALGSPPETW